MTTLKSITLRSIVALTLISTIHLLTSAQEKPRENATVPPPRIELLKLEGSKPNLKADGEGLTSYKIYHLFKSGVTRVKPYDLNTAIELRIFVYISEGSGSQLKQTAQLVRRDEYVASFKSLTWECYFGPCYVWAVATDDLDVKTISPAISFRVARRE